MFKIVFYVANFAIILIVSLIVGFFGIEIDDKSSRRYLEDDERRLREQEEEELYQGDCDIIDRQNADDYY